MAQSIDTENYVGLSPYAAAQGQSAADSLTGFVAGGAAAAAATGIGTVVARDSTLKMVQKTPLIGSLAKTPMRATLIAGAVAATVVSSIMSITGYFRGQRIASDGRIQFETLKGERDMARAENANLQQQVVQLQTGLQEQTSQMHELTKKFSEQHAARAPHASHAEAVHAERAHHPKGEHGEHHGEHHAEHASHAEKHGEHAGKSHAEAALASKEAASHAELGA